MPEGSENTYYGCSPWTSILGISESKHLNFQKEHFRENAYPQNWNDSIKFQDSNGVRVFPSYMIQAMYKKPTVKEYMRGLELYNGRENTKKIGII